MKELILLFMIVPVIGYSQVVAKEENGTIKAGNTVVQSTIKNPSPQEMQRQSNFNLEELKVRWKKAALENCSGVPCITTPPFTCGTSTISDIDGNTYNTVLIGTQCWMKENLKVTKYNDGIPIDLDNSGGVNGSDMFQVWDIRTSGAMTVYSNEIINGTHVATYGILYNWYAATDSRKICPEGWHIPNDDEWTTLSTGLGSNVGGKLKSTSSLWNTPNTGADNSSGFSALPGGLRDDSNGTFSSKGVGAFFWSSTIFPGASAGRTRYLINTRNDLLSVYYDKYVGASLRCLKD